MSKAKRLIDILLFVSAKKKFTAQEIADTFHISVRTVHRYLLDLSDMGLPIYAEQGRHGGAIRYYQMPFSPLYYLPRKKRSLFSLHSSLCIIIVIYLLILKFSLSLKSCMNPYRRKPRKRWIRCNPILPFGTLKEPLQHHS